MERFKKFITGYTDIPPEEWEIIKKSFERKEYSKDEQILEEGKICKYFYYLEQGLIRFYNLVDGNDTTKFFTYAPYCFTSKNSFRNQEPATESIQTLEKTVVWRINLQQANELLKLNSWNIFTRKFIHEVQSHTEELLMEIKTETAEERYIKLQKKYPELIQKIPLRHLSTFLWIAPQSLSRIRKRISN